MQKIHTKKSCNDFQVLMVDTALVMVS